VPQNSALTGVKIARKYVMVTINIVLFFFGEQNLKIETDVVFMKFYVIKNYF